LEGNLVLQKQQHVRDKFKLIFIVQHLTISELLILHSLFVFSSNRKGKRTKISLQCYRR